MRSLYRDRRVFSDTCLASIMRFDLGGIPASFAALSFREHE